MSRSGQQEQGKRAAACKWLACLLVSWLMAAIPPVAAQDASQGIRFDSVEAANRAIEEVERDRVNVERQYVLEQRACHDKFLVTSCMDEAKERRRLALARLNPVDVEARAYLRRERVAQRDRALEERRRDEQAEALQRDAEMKAREEAQERRLKNHEERLKESAAEAAAAARKNPRVLKQEDRIRQREEQEKRDAAQRAQNVADYERKATESQARQRQVAERKAQREKEQAERAKSAAGQKNQSVPPGQPQ